MTLVYAAASVAPSLCPNAITFVSIFMIHDISTQNTKYYRLHASHTATLLTSGK